MRAIEFRATIKNGIIEIPAQYREQFEANVRVIILAEEKEAGPTLIDQLFETPLKIKDFKPLSRSEIYDRG